ncbi:gene transfer agent family protein [Phaeobacter sp. CNT1-3]|nr:gene transfer agent family protein [Phaeobacter sp. CNT1-3]
MDQITTEHANHYAGEVTLVLNGEPQVLKLTLGALAELEASLGADTLIALVERFETGAFSSRDVLALLLAGLRGGGWRGSAADLASADIGGGPMAAARIAATLLLRAFSLPEQAS